MKLSQSEINLNVWSDLCKDVYGGRPDNAERRWFLNLSEDQQKGELLFTQAKLIRQIAADEAAKVEEARILNGATIGPDAGPNPFASLK